MAAEPEQRRRTFFNRKASPTDIGLVGFGKIGETGHYPVLTMHSQSRFHLVGIADPSVTHKHIGQIEVFPSLDGLLEIPGLQAVSIATPPNSHAPLAIRAMEAGKAVLLEKPPARTTAELRYMQDAAAHNDVLLFPAYHARYGRVVRAAKDEIARQKRKKGAKVKFVDIFYNENIENYHDLTTSWVINPEISGGGATRDSGLNALSAVHEILQDDFDNLRLEDAQFWRPEGYINPVTAVPVNFQVETKSSIEFRLGKEGNIVGRLRQNWLSSAPEERRIHIVTVDNDGTTKNYHIDLIHKTVTVIDDYPRRTTVLFDGNAGKRKRVDRVEEYTGVYNDFYEHLHTGSPLVQDAEMELIDEAYLRNPAIFTQTLRNYDIEIWRRQQDQARQYPRILTTTRIHSSFPQDRIPTTVEAMAHNTSQFGPAVIISNNTYPHLDRLSHVAQATFEPVTVDSYNGSGMDHGGMHNVGIDAAREKGIPLFATVSTDLIKFVPRVFPLMKKRLLDDPDLAVVGVAIHGVHDMDLLADIEKKKARVTSQNFWSIISNNAFSLFRSRPSASGREIPTRFHRFMQHERSLGSYKGRHEELALILSLLQIGYPLKTLLLAGDMSIVRDPAEEVASADDKMQSREPTAEFYKQLYEISEEPLQDYLDFYFAIEFVH